MTERVRRWAWICAAVAVLVHANTLANGFAYDDVDIIEQNEALHSWSGIVDHVDEPYWPGHYGRGVGAWRPVITTLFGVQWMVSGGDPALFHAVGALLHGATTFLVVLLLLELVPLAAAVSGGLLFAVHPVHAEAVANLVGNAEVLASLFVVAALLVHLRGGERYGWRRTLAVAGLFSLGVLTKENAVVLPALVFLVDAAVHDPGVRDLPDYLRRRWPVYLALVVVVVALFAARIAVLGEIAPPQVAAGATLLDEVPRVFTVASTWPHYVRLLLWPADLAADYGGIIPVVVMWTFQAVLGVGIALFFLGVGLWGWRAGGPMEPDRLSPRALGFAVVWFGASILPASNIVFISPVVVAERNLYLPSVAAAVGLGYFLAALLRERRAAGLTVLTALVVLGAGRTWERNRVWVDSWTPFDVLFEDHPEASRAWFFQGERLARESRFPEARRAYAVALTLMDSDYSTASVVARRFMGMGPSYERVSEFLLLRAWEEQPAFYTAPGGLAILYLNQQRYEEGERFARAALERAPENPDVHRVLGAHLSGLGRPEEAIPHRIRAVELEDEPRPTWWFWLASDHAVVGDTGRALSALDSARSEAPAEGPVRTRIDSLAHELGGDGR